MPSGSRMSLWSTAFQSGGPFGSGDDATGKDVSDVGIGEGRAEARHRFDVAQRANLGRSVDAEQAENVVGVGRQAGALGQQVEDAELCA